jgi:hypothetical protein
MKRFLAICACITIALTCASFSSYAQTTPSVDISLSADLMPSTNLPPGAEGRITLTFRNMGPDAATAVSAITTPYPFGPGEQIVLFPVSGTTPCLLFFDDVTPLPGGTGYFIMSVIVGPLAVGQTITCTIGIRTLPRAVGAYRLAFTATGASPGVVEPNLSNNVVTFDLVFGTPNTAAVVPTLSWQGAVLLVIALLIAARWRTRA